MSDFSMLQYQQLPCLSDWIQTNKCTFCILGNSIGSKRGNQINAGTYSRERESKNVNTASQSQLFVQHQIKHVMKS